MIFAIIIRLSVILYQDVKHRAIHWLLLPLLFVCGLYLKFNELSFLSLVYNALFIILLMGTLLIYLRLRFGQFVNPLKNHFGIGDVLFLFAIIPFFAFPLFMPLFSVGTIFTLIIYLPGYLLKKQKTIPYAGYFALFLAIHLSLETWIPSYVQLIGLYNG
jgi:hypothetical protein